ncbi:hypothetical protein CALVIDRAFT_489806, partial [Calocera viscosa TUFC12733]
FAVVKGVISKEKAAEYAVKGDDWLEGFNLGYKRDDRSTWNVKNLPRHNRGGLYGQFSFSHAQFVWDAKSEPGIVKLFETIWGTDKLTVSFDGGSLSVPLPPDQIQNGGAPWPHSDQSAYRPQQHTIQGLLNLLPNGPDDGGLMVIKGSSNLFKQYFEEHKKEEPAGGWPKRDTYPWQESELQWFFDRGCEWVKPYMEPGDFVLWDSREVHYGAAPKPTANKRFAIYICYKPADLLTEEQRETKVEAFKRGYVTVRRLPLVPSPFSLPRYLTISPFYLISLLEHAFPSPSLQLPVCLYLPGGLYLPIYVSLALPLCLDSVLPHSCHC